MPTRAHRSWAKGSGSGRYRRGVGSTKWREWSLGGEWLVRAAGRGGWRTVADRSLDDSRWSTTRAPGRWWTDDGLENATAVLYRRRFELPLPSEESADRHAGDGHAGDGHVRDWLLATGLCDLGHVWLDGAYLGDMRGRHHRHTFEVTGRLAPRAGHLIAVEAAKTPHRGYEPQNALDAPVADVRIRRTGPARIERARALVIEADYDQAMLRIAATVDSAGTHRGEVTITVAPVAESTRPAPAPSAAPDGNSAPEASSVPEASVTQSAPVLARGRNQLEWLIALEQPALWWPNSMGAQPQYAVTINVAVDGETSDTDRRRVGVRTVASSRGDLLVNGEKFASGPDGLVVVEHDLVHHGVYESADDAGTLLCQQITLERNVIGGGDRSLRAVAGRAAHGAVDHIGHHPSVVAWQPLRHLSGRRALLGTGPWEDRVVHRALRDVDPTRPVWLRNGI